MTQCSEPFPWDEHQIWEPAACNRPYGHDGPHTATVQWHDLTHWPDLDDDEPSDIR